MWLYKGIKVTIILIVFIVSILMSPIYTCEDTVIQVKEEKVVVNTPPPMNTDNRIHDNIPVIKELVKENPYTYYEVYDFFYGSDEYHFMDYELQEYTYDLCVEYGIEEFYTLILCQLYYESKYEADVISKTNDYGIAQINKCNHKWLKDELGITDFLDAKQGILCNIYIMSGYLKKYSVESSLFCYNTGKPKGSNTYSENIMYMWNNGVKEIKE